MSEESAQRTRGRTRRFCDSLAIREALQVWPSLQASRKDSLGGGEGLWLSLCWSRRQEMGSSWCLRISGRRLRKGGVDLGIKIALLASRRCAVSAGLRILNTGGKGGGQRGRQSPGAEEPWRQRSVHRRGVGGDDDCIGEGTAGSAKRQRLQGGWERTASTSS